MNLKALLSLSPTLLLSMWKARKNPAKSANLVFNSKTARLTISVITDNSHTPLEFSLSELPDEFRRAFHDYATRLHAEIALLEHAINIVPETVGE